MCLSGICTSTRFYTTKVVESAVFAFLQTLLGCFYRLSHSHFRSLSHARLTLVLNLKATTRTFGAHTVLLPTPSSGQVSAIGNFHSRNTEKTADACQKLALPQYLCAHVFANTRVCICVSKALKEIRRLHNTCPVGIAFARDIVIIRKCKFDLFWYFIIFNVESGCVSRLAAYQV